MAKSRHDAKQKEVPRQMMKNHGNYKTNHLFRGRRVLGDGLGAFRHGVLGKLTGQDQADRGLDLPRGDGGLLVVGSQLRGLGSDSLEDV